MAGRYEAYPDYKYSECAWIGQIPVHWKTAALSKLFCIKAGGDLKATCFSEKKTGVHPYPIYTNTNNENAVYGYTSKCNYAPNTITVSGRGDVGFAVFRDHAYDAIIRLLVLAPDGDSYCKFFVYFINEVIDFRVESSAIGQLSTQQISPYQVAFPPIGEQTQIANFLDHETAKIDTLIAKQQQLITLLKEKRQAVISHAVTKGLNPATSMRDSGVEWLGEVPEHWGVTRFKYQTVLFEQGWSPQCDSRPAELEEYGVLKVGCVNNGVFLHTENKSLPNELEPRLQYLVKKDDLLISRANTKELVGSAAVVDKNYSNLILCDKLYRLRFGKTVNPYLIAYYLALPLVRQQIELEATGASHSMQNIGHATIKELPLLMMPVDEANALVAAIDTKVDAFDSILSKAEKEISLLQERRAALISATVTGKIDVRHWQAPASSKKTMEATP